MSLLYYILLAFGGLLVIYVLTSWFVTKKKINEYNGTENKLATFAQNVKSKLSLWVFYFSGGNRKNILRNSVISVLSFLAFFAINVSYIHIDRLTFSVIFIFTFLILIWKLGQRRNRIVFNNVFPEVIQILVAASSSGAGLLQGLERCGQELTGQLGTEFRNIHRRLAIGEDPIAVFDESYTRYPYKEFYFFITIIRANLSKGGQIKEVISRLGRVIADSSKMEKKKKAMTSEARMSAIIVACFPIGFFIFMKFTMPDNFEFITTDPTGRYVLYYVFGSVAFGMLIILGLMRKST